MSRSSMKIMMIQREAGSVDVLKIREWPSQISQYPTTYSVHQRSRHVMKRTKSLIGNPFVKLLNKEWEVDAPTLSSGSISPPSIRSSRGKSAVNTRVQKNGPEASESQPVRDPPSAAVEAGEVSIRDHLRHFSTALSKFALSSWPRNTPRIGIEEFRDLYLRNQNDTGRHFVIHQHDHPVAGVHYDLRLQISKTSSISFAIMYGLPGRVDSRRLNRNATETRVHNVWVSCDLLTYV